MKLYDQGLDLSGIQLVIQWKAPASINTIWQRFGRAARGEYDFAFAILIAEKEHFDEEKERKEQAKAKRNERAKRKRNKEQSMNAPNKQRAVESTAEMQPTRPAPTDHAGPGDDDGADDGSSGTESEDDSGVVDQRMREDNEARAASESNIAAAATESVQEEDERRRETYNQREKAPTTKANQERTLQPAVLDLINAGSRGLGCRRKLLTLVYSNDKRSASASISLSAHFSRLFPSFRPHAVR